MYSFLNTNDLMCTAGCTKDFLCLLVETSVPTYRLWVKEMCNVPSSTGIIYNISNMYINHLS